MCSFCILVSIPTAQAAAQGSADAVTNNVAFYSVSYIFTTDDYELIVPMGTKRSSATSHDNLFANAYTFTSSEGGDGTAGETAGIVLSDAPVVDGNYRIPANSSATFTLFVILKLDEDAPRAKYGLQMTHLPFSIVRDSSTEQQQIGTPQLGAYRTAQIGLNK